MPARPHGVRLRARGLSTRATAPLRLRPTFLVIGAQKSGTTSLHRHLADHPGVVCATPKEVHYFNVNFFQPRAWYLAHFPLKTRGLAIRRGHGIRPAVGEITPGYLFHPRVPERVHAFDAHLKLIAVLRDPVERAYSQYQMQVRKRGETLSFEEALDREETDLPAELERLRKDPSYISPNGLRHSYVARGRYAEQLERWLDLFPREQLLVLTSEELLGNPGETMSRVTPFLEIPESRAASYPLEGVREYPRMSPAVRERLAHVFEPENRKLEELLGRELAWTRPDSRAPEGSSKSLIR